MSRSPRNYLSSLGNPLSSQPSAADLCSFRQMHNVDIGRRMLYRDMPKTSREREVRIISMFPYLFWHSYSNAVMVASTAQTIENMHRTEHSFWHYACIVLYGVRIGSTSILFDTDASRFETVHTAQCSGEKPKPSLIARIIASPHSPGFPPALSPLGSDRVDV